ncbi:hypothetical protein SEPCBS119000_000704 [Sporothrix epigloea]|uniref:SET domain-containing protein n=1 Tax=Sporothrix epigloea TaxID=1892477 RepID=A0ABP0D6J4_9PEZI
MAEKASGSRMAALLEQREQLTEMLQEKPYDFVLYLRRAVVYTDMAYPDLAIGDAYRALLLSHELGYKYVDYYERVYETIRVYSLMADFDGVPEVLRNVVQEQTLAALDSELDLGDKPQPKKRRQPGDDFSSDDGFNSDIDAALVAEDCGLKLPVMSTFSAVLRRPWQGDDLHFPLCKKWAFIAKIRSYQIMSLNLLLCGCLGSARSQSESGLKDDPDNRELLQIKELIDTAGRQRLRQKCGNGSVYNPASLPDRGFVRREVYPWNTYEPDRCSPASLAALNLQLSIVAPKCEVRVLRLPVLATQEPTEDVVVPATRWQLGVFAKEPIAAGKLVLREFSILTASSRYEAAICHACKSDISGTNDATGVNNSSVESRISCRYCSAVYCSEECHRRALDTYHDYVCEEDGFDYLAKDPWRPRDAADDELYLLLLSRVLAMSYHQGRHMLELKEVKYLWGDFVPVAINAQEAISSNDLSPYSPEVVAMAAAGANPPAAWSLPFSFADSIVAPLNFMESMKIDMYKFLVKKDVWVLNTVFAKLRGTASARQSRQDGPPDVAAVHPLWSLVNHDCDPNVTWEWGARMVLRAREDRVQLAEDKAAGVIRPGGIAAGEEILSHYCDLALPVQLRREWARGSLGGTCMCLRCQNEAAVEQGDRKHSATNKADPACTCLCHK